MYQLYYKSNKADSCDLVSIPYRIETKSPGLFCGLGFEKSRYRQILFNFYWWIITLGQYKIWCVWDGDILVHTSYVIPRCIKFPFLKKGQIEIGPCYTHPSYRGKGIYPAVLQAIGGGI